jgi:PAS domain S-box-containing protein
METAQTPSSKWKYSYSFIVLIITLILTFFGWKATQSLIQKQGETRLISEVDIVEHSLGSSVAHYEGSLAGIKGLFSASVEVERDEFNSYYEGVDIPSQYPGMYTLVHVRLVSDDDLPGFMENLKAELNEKNLPGELSYETSAEPQHYIVDFIANEQQDQPVVYGLDLTIDPRRREILEKARDTGMPTASEPLILHGPEKSGFIITTPIYKNSEPTATLEEKRKALVGFVNATFIYEDLLNDILSTNQYLDLEVHIKDGGDLIYDSVSPDTHTPEGELTSGYTSIAQRTISVGGRNWEIDFFGDPISQVSEVESRLPLIVLLVGILLSVLLFGITYSLSNSQMRAENMAIKMTADLQIMKLAVDSTYNQVIITDIDGRITYANKSTERITGYTGEEIIGNNPRLWGTLMDKVFYQNMWHTIKDLRKPFSAEIRNKRKDGQEYDVVVTISPITDKNNQLVGFVGVEADITVENSARKALRHEKDRMNLIVSSMGEGLLVVNPEYKIEMINATAAHLFGIDEDEAVGKSWYELVKAYIGNQEIPLKKRVSVQVMDKAVTIPTELDDDHYYYVEKSGRKFPVVSVTTPIFEDEKVVGAVKIFRDASIEKEAKIFIRERIKSTAKELVAEQTKSHVILENTTEGVILTDNNAKITYVNPAFVKMIGIKEKELVGKEFPDAIDAYNLKKEKMTPSEISDAAAVTAKKNELKMFIQTSEQKMLGTVTNSAPVYSGDTFVGIVREMHDITEEINLQQQKDDFFSIASHELRTPLSVIAGNLDTVLSGYGKSEITNADMQLLQDTMSAADRLIKMVSDFLNVSRLDQGRLKYQVAKVDSCAITNEVVREMKPLVEKKGLSLLTSCIEDPSHRNILADEGMFKEVLINLIGNSLKFTEKGSIKIEHQLKDNMLLVKVIDTGIGIAKDKQDLLFHRFQQAMDKTLSREAGGTGLGLYISREFVRIMGGELALEQSEPGKGSTFSFTLPLANRE